MDITITGKTFEKDVGLTVQANVVTNDGASRTSPYLLSLEEGAADSDIIAAIAALYA